MRNTLKTYGRIYIFVALILLPFVIFIQAARYDFVWNDKELYINNKHLSKDSPMENLLNFWFPKENEMYAPVTYTAWSISASVSPGSKAGSYQPYIFHLLNILIHIANGLLVFLILNKLLKDQWPAFAGALVFAVHPLQVEPVAWISETRGLLAGFFGFLSVWLYVRHVRKLEQRGATALAVKAGGTEDNAASAQVGGVKQWPPEADHAISVVAAILSMLSKPSGVVIPFIIIILDYFILRRDIKKTLYSTLGMLVAALTIIITTLVTEASPDYVENISILQRPIVFLDTIVFYLYKLFLPFNLVASYGRTPEYIVHSAWIFFAILVPVALIITFLVTRRRSSNYLAAFLIFVIGYLPVSGLIPFYYQYFSTVADKYVYISMLGAAFAFAYFMSYKKGSKFFIGLAIFIILVLSALSIGQTRAWRDNFTLWNNAIEKYPDKSALAYSGRGLEYMKKGHLTEAMEDFSKAINLNPRDASYYYHRGVVFMGFNNFNRAIDDFTFSLNLRPDNAKAWYNRGICYSEIGKHALAIEDFSAALKYNSALPNVYVNRGISYAQTGRLNEAINDFSKAVEINPGDSEAIYNLKQTQEILSIHRMLK